MDKEKLISIHVSREGYDSFVGQYHSLRTIFQSTYPVRDTTADIHTILAHFAISIHVSREGYDSMVTAWSRLSANFNPRIP